MYTPHSFAEHDLQTLHGFIEAHPLAAVVTHSPEDGVVATHLPLVLAREAGPMIRNCCVRIWRRSRVDTRAVAIIRGT